MSISVALKLYVEGVVDVIEVPDPPIAHRHNNPLALVKPTDCIHLLLGQTVESQ